MNIIPLLEERVEEIPQYHFKDGKWQHSSRDYEEQTDLRDISHIYQMPDDQKPEDIFREYVWKHQMMITGLEDLISIIELEDGLLPTHDEVKSKRAEIHREIDQKERDFKSEWHIPYPFSENNRKLGDLKYQSLPWDILDIVMDSHSDATLDDLRNALPVAETRHLASCLEAYHRLTDLNPELEGMGCDETNRMQIFHAVMGILSSYNPRDVQFMAVGCYSGEGWKFPAPVMARKKEAEKEIGAYMDWVPAPSTLAKIEQQIGRHRQTGRGT